jgi:hypothetical protein
MFRIVLPAESSPTSDYVTTFVIGDAMSKLEFEVQGCGGLRLGLLSAPNLYDDYVDVVIGTDEIHIRYRSTSVLMLLHAYQSPAQWSKIMVSVLQSEHVVLGGRENRIDLFSEQIRSDSSQFQVSTGPNVRRPRSFIYADV